MQRYPERGETLGPHVIVDAVRHRPHDHLLVLLAFDGVLAEYEVNPDAVYLTQARHDLLRLLVQTPSVTVGLVSGRTVADLEARTRLGEEAFYIGLHGLEIKGPHDFSHQPALNPDQYRTELWQLASALERSIAEVDGARVEYKGLAVALHTRGAGSSDAVWCRLHMLNQAARLVNTGKFRVVRGNHVLELVPNAGPGRAAAIAAVRRFLTRRHQRPVFTVYVGENVADDDSRMALGSDAVTAFVGGEGAGASLDTPEDVERLMAHLSAIRDGTAEPSEPAPWARI